MLSASLNGKDGSQNQVINVQVKVDLVMSLHSGQSLTVLSFPSLFCCSPGTRGI